MISEGVFIVILKEEAESTTCPQITGHFSRITWNRSLPEVYLTNMDQPERGFPPHRQHQKRLSSHEKQIMFVKVAIEKQCDRMPFGGRRKDGRLLSHGIFSKPWASLLFLRLMGEMRRLNIYFCYKCNKQSWGKFSSILSYYC